MNKEQKTHYTKIKKHLDSLGLYNPADETIIQDAAYCRTLIDEARQIVEGKEGEQKHLQKFPTGAIQISPAITNLRALQKDWLDYCTALGLSPKARKALDIESAKPKAISKLMQIKSKKAV